MKISKWPKCYANLYCNIQAENIDDNLIQNSYSSLWFFWNKKIQTLNKSFYSLVIEKIKYDWAVTQTFVRKFSASVISWRRVWRDQEYSCSGVTLAVIRHQPAAVTEKWSKSCTWRVLCWRAQPGFEPGTSRTRSANHTPRPTSPCWSNIWSKPSPLWCLFSSVVEHQSRKLGVVGSNPTGGRILHV